MIEKSADNQRCIDAARERGEETFTYTDPESGECLLVSGSASSIRMLRTIVSDYEMAREIVAGALKEIDRLKGEEMEHAN
jgi:hypothetical protein